MQIPAICTCRSIAQQTQAAGGIPPCPEPREEGREVCWPLAGTGKAAAGFAGAPSALKDDFGSSGSIQRVTARGAENPDSSVSM